MKKKQQFIRDCKIQQVFCSNNFDGFSDVTENDFIGSLILKTMHANAENILNILFALGAEAIKYSDFIFEILFPCFLSVPPLATEQVNVLCFNLSKLNDMT